MRREEEYRQLATLSSTTTTITSSSTAEAVEFEAYTINGNGNDTDVAEQQQQDELDHDQGVLVTAQPAAVQTTSLLLPIDELSNTPSLASSVNSAKEESLDGQHSDDSGISASSQTNNQAKQQAAPLKLTVVTRQEQRYIGPNCYNMTPEPPQQKLITRTISTPQLSGLPQKRQFAFGGAATKGVMQRFIASHGKLVTPSSPLPPTSPLGASNGAALQNGGQNGSQNGSQNGNNNTLKLNTRTALAFLENGNNNSPSSTLSPAAIERDSRAGRCVEAMCPSSRRSSGSCRTSSRARRSSSGCARSTGRTP